MQKVEAPSPEDSATVRAIQNPGSELDSLLAEHGRGLIDELFFELPSTIELTGEGAAADFVFVEALAVRAVPNRANANGDTTAIWFTDPRGGVRIIWSSHGWSGQELVLHRAGRNLRGMLRPFSDVYSEQRGRRAVLRRTRCPAAPA